MDFKKSGIPGFSVSEPFESFIDKLSDVSLESDFGYEVLKGWFILEGRSYFLVVDQNPDTGKVGSIGLNSFFEEDTFEGIEMLATPVDEFAAKLARIGSTPIVSDPMIWWPKERITFYIFEGYPSAIAWWGTDLIDHEAQQIFDQE